LKRSPRGLVVVVMGVAGTGKTTIGARLAARCGWPFVDGDALHSAASRAKMAAGEPLDDADRLPWLQRIQRTIREHEAARSSLVIACSALKREHRRILLAGTTTVRLVHLRGDRGLIAARLRERRGHFFPPALLDSQLAALEEPEEAVTVDVDGDVEGVTERVLRGLGLAAGTA
jgi:gluconokinase